MQTISLALTLGFAALHTRIVSTVTGMLTAMLAFFNPRAVWERSRARIVGIFAFACLLLLASNTQVVVCCPTATTLYVDQSISASGDGTTWANAFKTLDEALFIAHTCPTVTTINVAAGTYKPTKKPYNTGVEMTTADARDVTFHLPDGIAMYGGFPNGGGTRNITANPTILSGDFSGNDVVTGSGSTLSIANNGENAYHVVLASAPISGGVGVTVDGFIISGGNANGGGFGIVVNGNNVSSARGGGILIFRGANTLANNTFRGNYAQDGGGILTYSITNTLTNNTILHNSAEYGGGMLISGGTLTNNTIIGNVATYVGGGIYILGNNTLTNNTIVGNSIISFVSYGGAGIITQAGSNTLTNNLFWGNIGADYVNPGAGSSEVPATNNFIHNLMQFTSSEDYGNNNELGADINNLFGDDPLFVDAADPDGADNIHRTADDGLALQAGSPAINAGTTPTPAVPTDILGNARIGAYDIGAYERQSSCTASTASSSPTLCINTALTPVTHTTTGATGIGAASGLPAGVSAAWANDEITISGTPTESGTFNYTIPLTGGCGLVNASGTITVGSCSFVFRISDPCSCRNNATTLTNGQFTEEVTALGPAGFVVRAQTITGLYQTTSTAQVIVPFSAPVNMPYNGIDGYSLTGVHVDNIGYTVVAGFYLPDGITPIDLDAGTSGVQNTLSLTNKCAYPNPDFGLAASVCNNATPITLTATNSYGPNGTGVFSGTGVVGGNTFSSTTAGIGGPYPILLTYTGGIAVATTDRDGDGDIDAQDNGVSPDNGTTPAYPGCIQTTTKSISVTNCCAANAGTW